MRGSADSAPLNPGSEIPSTRDEYDLMEVRGHRQTVSVEDRATLRELRPVLRNDDGARNRYLHLRQRGDDLLVANFGLPRVGSRPHDARGRLFSLANRAIYPEVGNEPLPASWH